MPHLPFINDPDHWRNRAKEMHTLADGITKQHVRETMLKIAAEYERTDRRPQPK